MHTLNFNKKNLYICLVHLQIMALTLSDMGLLCCKSGIFFLFSHMASEQGRPIIPLMWGSPHGLTTSHSLVPYHYSTGSRISVLELWQDTHIHTISYVTVKLLLLSWGISDLKLLFSELWWEEIKCLSQRPGPLLVESGLFIAIWE